MGEEQMMMWPAVTLLGFLVLTALVIAMGTSSTARYERERAELSLRRAHAAAEPVGAVRRLTTERPPNAPPLRPERAGRRLSGVLGVRARRGGVSSTVRSSDSSRSKRWCTRGSSQRQK